MPSPVQAFRNGAVSFWYRELGLPKRRAALPGDADYDVCIVGAGYTGLWTAYYLKKASPSCASRSSSGIRGLRRVRAERRLAVRVSSLAPGSRYAKEHGEGAVIALQRAMMATVDEVITVASDEGIDADIVKGGMRIVATNHAQKARLLQEIAYLQEWGDGRRTTTSWSPTTSR